MHYNYIDDVYYIDILCDILCFFYHTFMMPPTSNKDSSTSKEKSSTTKEKSSTSKEKSTTKENSPSSNLPTSKFTSIENHETPVDHVEIHPISESLNRLHSASIQIPSDDIDTSSTNTASRKVIISKSL